MRHCLKSIIVSLAILFIWPVQVSLAQLQQTQAPNTQKPRTLASKCIAMAEYGPRVHKASLQTAQTTSKQVNITYVGHSTFLIRTPEGVNIATDFTGYAGAGIVPHVVTMNHAHDSHYTDFPDPAIKHVLRGWNPKGGYADHNIRVKDVLIRNVPTNIRGFGSTTEEFGNSIFIFETAGLCIGHLGHLHHELTAQQLGQIGQLDIVMVPIDGTWTLDVEGMVKVLTQLQARVVIPMHYFSSFTLDRFIDAAKGKFELRNSDNPSITLSVSTMPKSPELWVLRGGLPRF